MEFNKFEDHKADYEVLARTALAKPGRFTAMMSTVEEDGSAPVTANHVADTVDDAIAWFDLVPGRRVRQYVLYDHLRSNATGLKMRTADVSVIKSYAAETTVESLARWLYWQACRAESVAPKT